VAEAVVGEVDDFTQDLPTKVHCDLGTLCVIRTAQGFRALDDTCTHETASLSEGDYYDDTDEIECPLHASTFDCATGQPTAPPATVAARVYAVTVRGDQVVVAEPA
jgi:3-phenylpropionate/trans-cinnamate dioxygenase ferredoxin subunit